MPFNIPPAAKVTPHSPGVLMPYVAAVAPPDVVSIAPFDLFAAYAVPLLVLSVLLIDDAVHIASTFQPAKL